MAWRNIHPELSSRASQLLLRPNDKITRFDLYTIVSKPPNIEAIAALSLACNIIQLAEIATKSVVLCKEVYNHGATIEQLQYKDNSANLRMSYQALEQSLHTSQNPQDAQIHSIAAEYIKVSKQLDDELQKLDARGTAGASPSKLRQFGKALRSS